MRMPLIFDIQRFSLHDGEGIRTTVFFKGCPLRCQWCHNPESQKFDVELMFYADRCINCGRCKSGRLSIDTCPSGAREIVGREYTVAELMRILLRDRQCYEVSGGGVTLSGGEVLAQDTEYIARLAKGLHDEGVSVYIDTCGYADWDAFQSVLPYADAFLFDIKCADTNLHEKYTGRGNDIILENLQRLTECEARVNLRVPVIPTVNDGEEMDAIISCAAENCAPFRVNLLPYHKLGADKRERLGAARGAEFDVPDNKLMEKIREKWLKAGFSDVRIGG